MATNGKVTIGTLVEPARSQHQNNGLRMVRRAKTTVGLLHFLPCTNLHPVFLCYSNYTSLFILHCDLLAHSVHQHNKSSKNIAEFPLTVAASHNLVADTININTKFGGSYLMMNMHYHQTAKCIHCYTARDGVTVEIAERSL